MFLIRKIILVLSPSLHVYELSRATLIVRTVVLLADLFILWSVTTENEYIRSKRTCSNRDQLRRLYTFGVRASKTRELKETVPYRLPRFRIVFARRWIVSRRCKLINDQHPEYTEHWSIFSFPIVETSSKEDLFDLLAIRVRRRGVYNTRERRLHLRLGRMLFV